MVDRLTGGVPVAVRSYIKNSPAALEHHILAPFEDGRPAQIWHGLAASHADLGSAPLGRFTRVRAEVRRLEPYILHAHSSFAGAYARVGAPRGTFIAYSPHCFKFDDPDLSRAHRAVFRSAEKLMAGRTDRYVVLSEWEAHLARSLAPRAEVVFVPNTASIDTLESAGERPAESVVGMLGRIAPQKDPALFAQISRALRDGETGVQCTWIGAGEGALVAQLEAAEVHVTGWCSSAEVGNQLDRLDVYVHTAQYEGFPLSVLDAAARRVPVIARRIPALVDTPLTLFDTAEEAVALITRATQEPQFRDGLVRASATLTDRMNASTQRRALTSAWMRPTPAAHSMATAP